MEKTKICNKCFVEQPLNSFYKNKESADGHINQCKDCKKKIVKTYSDKNKDKISEYQKQYQSENREKINSQKRLYNQKSNNPQKNRKKYREKNRDILNKKNKEYRESERGKELHKISEERRRSRKKDLVSDLTLEQWNDTLLNWKDENDILHCAYCSCIVDSPHQEHIVPLSKGGAYTKSNIIPSCKNCNNEKYTKTLQEFYEYSDTFSKESYQKIVEFVQLFESEVV